MPVDACVRDPKNFMLTGPALLRIRNVNGNDRNVANVHNLTNCIHSIIANIIDAKGPIVILRMPIVSRQRVGPYALGVRDSNLVAIELVLMLLTTPSTVMTKLLIRDGILY